MPSAMGRREFLAMAGAGVTALASAVGAVRRPNVILVFADDMGYGDLGCYGHPTIRTPHLDQMATEGIRLTSFYAAAPFCTPSRAALLTGRYPMRSGLYNNLGPGSKNGLPTSEITLGAAMKTRGYRTMCIGKWHLGHMPPYLPTARGFDQFFGLPYSNDMRRPWVETDVPLRLYRDAEPIEDPGDQEDLTERYTEEATRFIRESHGRPFFLYLPHSMPHLPVRTSERFKGTSRSGLYGDVIETLDWGMGEILRTLRDEGVDDNTLVIFTSDNGPWLNLPDRMLQEGNQRWHAGTKGPLRGSKGDTYEGGMRVPCIARWPGRIPEGQVSVDIASTLDLFATITDLGGVRLPGDREYDGQDLMPFLEGREPSPVSEFFYFRSNNLEAVRQEQWKLRLTRHVRNDVPEGEPVPPELFDLDQDPGEMYNRAEELPERTAEMTERLREFGGELGANVSS